MNNGFGFGLIGCGLIAIWHAQAINKIENAHLIGVTDTQKDFGKRFAHKYNTLFNNSVKELLMDDEIDIVCICTPSGLHKKLAIEAIESGKHIIIEKPMALNTEECDEIIEACEKNEVQAAVISQLRFTKTISQLKTAIDSGDFGKLINGDIYMKFYRSQEYYDKSSWKGTWRMDGGGALMNQGIHGIDLLQYIMGPVKSVAGYSKTLARKIEVEDTVSAVVEFKSGALGVIQATTSAYPGCPRRLEINGEKGTVIIEEDTIIQWEFEGKEDYNTVISEHTTNRTFNDPSAFTVDGHEKQIRDLINSISQVKAPLVDQYEGKKYV